MSPDDWRRLGIDPTLDKGAIRRGYAARLKAMDVDADPDGFARLRAARDAALAHADRGGIDDPEPDEDWFDADWFDADPVAATHREPPAPAAPGDPELDAIDAQYRALVALLFTDAAPTPADRDAIEHHGRALLADPRMEDVGFAASAERWFADNLAATIPRSDPLLEPAAALFGWIARRDDYALLPGAHQVVERIGGMRYAAIVSDPSHRLHRAWADLTHADGANLGRRSDVAEVMATVRSRYPAAEAWMDPDRVAVWDARAPDRLGPGKITVWTIIAVVVLLRVLVMHLYDDPAPPTPTVAAMPSADEAAQMLAGRTMADVRTINPPLAAAIDRALLPPTGADGAEPVRQAIAALGQRRMVAGIRDAPDPLVRSLARWEVDAMRALRPADPTRCVAIHVAMPPDGLPQHLRDRQRELLREVILYSRETPVDTGESRFTVPGAMLPAVARLSGLDPAKIRRTLQGNGSDTERCTVDIALREAALAPAAGAAGAALLRDMQPLLNE